MATRACAGCGETGTSDHFTKRQWKKGVGRSRCLSCVTQGKSASDAGVHNHGSRAHFSQNALEYPFSEGGFRYVALGNYVDEDGSLGAPCVAKWLKDEWALENSAYSADLRCVRRALQFVSAFNAAGVCDYNLLVVIPSLARFSFDSVLPGVVHLREPYLEDYDKWNSNSGWYQDTSDFADAMQALSHFSYHASGGQHILCDLQGGFDSEEGSIVLTDPAILSVDQSFGETDFGPEGIASFFYEHECTAYCNPKWRLPDHVAPYHDVVEATSRWSRSTSSDASGSYAGDDVLVDELSEFSEEQSSPNESDVGDESAYADEESTASSSDSSDSTINEYEQEQEQEQEYEQEEEQEYEQEQGYELEQEQEYEQDQEYEYDSESEPESESEEPSAAFLDYEESYDWSPTEE